MNAHLKMRSLLIRAAVVAALCASLLVAMTSVSAPRAEAASASCGNGRCTVYLSKAETKALGNGRVPSVRFPNPVLTGAYYALAYGHVLFAKQYGNKNWCSAFRLDIRPWANQGYTGYRC